MDTPLVASSPDNGNPAIDSLSVRKSTEPPVSFGRTIATCPPDHPILGKPINCISLRRTLDTFSIVPVVGSLFQVTLNTGNHYDELSAVQNQSERLAKQTTQLAFANQLSAALAQLRTKKQELEQQASRHGAQNRLSLPQTIDWAKGSLGTGLPPALPIPYQAVRELFQSKKLQ